MNLIRTLSLGIVALAATLAFSQAQAAFFPQFPAPNLPNPMTRPYPSPYGPGFHSSWDCREEVQGRDGVLNQGICQMPTPWACYLKIERRCVDLDSGRIWVDHYPKYTGKCSDNLGDCIF